MYDNVCVHKHARLGVCGGMLPQENVDALRLFLRPLWDKSRAVVDLATALNTFTSFDAPSRDMCGWSMHCACVV